ncbi:MAG: ABC transporter substrate-binding protein [Deltaproteobacteria bacterium]|jgi:putative ABC transport system substrate-binding protein|nr:ABC transporter substrate-binding protein [Deltaproteobacteria bacterium]
MRQLTLRRLILGLVVWAVVAWASQAPAVWAYTISINQFVEHPSLNEAVRGFKEQLAELGVEATYLEHNAQGLLPTVSLIVNQILDEKPDLILAVATPCAQITAQGIKDIPILFTAVTDPVDAGLVASLDNPGGNVTGTTDMNPVAEQLALILEIQPGAKNIGVIYNPGEPNSEVQVKLAQAAAAKLGLTLVEAVAPNSTGVLQAVQSLVDRVDAIYLPTDNVVISNMETIINVALDQHIPLYPADDSSARRGGVAALSISYSELGRLTGRMAARILKDEAEPATTPVESLKRLSLVVNTRFASDIFLSVPPSVVQRAQVVIK